MIKDLRIKKISSIPIGIEYDELQRKLNQLYNPDIIDFKAILPKALAPGVSNKINNQSMINFEEPNTKPAYPQETIPYSQGLIWE